MHNELAKIKFRDKFKLLKLCKLKYIHASNSVSSRTKSENKNNNNKFQTFSFLQKRLYKKYNILPQTYNSIQLDNFIKGKYCHSLSKFKENLIFNYTKEFMKKFYTKKESIKKIPLFVEFYKTYLQFFCSPTLKELNLNELIEERVEIKAMAFYKENYEEKSDVDRKKDKKKFINSIFFTNQIRKDISRKNTLTDLSKTTIEFNSNSDKNYSNSNRSINSLIDEMNKDKNDINIINNNECNIKSVKKEKNENLTDRNMNKQNLINKNLCTNSFININQNEAKKIIPKIKLNLNLLKNKISKTNTDNTLSNKNIRYIKNEVSNSINSYRSNRGKLNTINNAKPMYQKINIVNNKIIIINNNSKSKRNILKQMTSKELKNRKKKKKNNLTLLTRNYINNNFFGSFYGNAFDLINSQDKIFKTKNFETSESIKIINKERKGSYNKTFNSSKIHNKKSINKINHIKKIKEKNMILKPHKYKNNPTDNNVLNNNLFSSYLTTGAKTERNLSKEKAKQKWTNFQMFNNNIKSINKIRHIKNISNEKNSSKNIKSTNSITNRTNKIKSILKISTFNIIEKNKNVQNKSKNIMITSKTKIKKNNSKLKSNINNNKENLLRILMKKKF